MRQIITKLILIFLIFFFNSCSADLTDKSGLYTTTFPNMSIELQSGGHVFVTPKNGKNNTFYCTTSGSWVKASETELTISLQPNENCDWLKELDGSWAVDECSTFSGKKTLCISKGTYKLIREK